MNKILKLDANLFFAISIISLSIGGIWMSYTEEKKSYSTWYNRIRWIVRYFRWNNRFYAKRWNN